MAPQISPDSQAIIMLTTQLGRGRGKGTANGPTPYALRDWNSLALEIKRSELGRPGKLLGLDASTLRSHLNPSTADPERIAALLDRGAQMALEVERLSSLGIWVVTRADDTYPQRLRATLKEHAPPVLFGAGEIELLSLPALAIVGSRDVDERGAAFAEQVGRLCARSNIAVVSGAARGIDKLAMGAALDADGTAFGVLADSLERAVRSPDNRRAIHQGHLVLLTQYQPDAGFSVGAAMGRNKVVYGVGKYGLVVSSSLDQGGTWAGAREVLNKNWVPLFVRSGDAIPEGNRELLRLGALSFPDPFPTEIDDLSSWLDKRSTEITPQLGQGVGHRQRQEYRAREESAVHRQVLETPDDRSLARRAAITEAAESDSPTDLFALVWPQIESYLSQPRTEAEIAVHFDLVSQQVKRWLARALAEKRVKKLGRPAKYRISEARASGNVEQPTLFSIQGRDIY